MTIVFNALSIVTTTIMELPIVTSSKQSNTQTKPHKYTQACFL